MTLRQPGASWAPDPFFAHDATSQQAMQNRSRLLALEESIAPYDLVTSASSRQRVSHWDDFDGRNETASGTTTACPPWYIISNGGGVTTDFVAHAVTGRTCYRINTGAGAGAVSYLAARSTFTPRSAENPWFKALLDQLTAPVGGTQDYYAGFRSGAASGLSDGIYFRSTNAGNWFLVCRSAGIETTVDMGVAPSTTLILVELRVSHDGAKVQGFLDSVPVSAAITTNIPTGLLNPIIMHDNRAATVTTAGQIRCFGIGWKMDPVA